MAKLLDPAERETAETLDSIDEVGTVVDTDSHVLERLEDLLPYVDDRYGAAREILRHSDNVRYDVIAGHQPMPKPGATTRFVDRLREEGTDPNDPEARTALNRSFGIDYSILNPGRFLLAHRTVQNDQVAVALADGYNRWLLDAVLDPSGDSVTGTILAAGQRPDLAAEEIDDRAGEDDMVAVQMLASGHVPPPSDRRYDPIYEAAQDNGLPIQFHSGTPAISHGFPLQHRWHEIYAEDKVIGHPFSHMWNLTKMLYQGIPERFPELRFNFQEAGIAWIPYMKWRLDDYYLQFTDEIPVLEGLPSEYIDDRFYFSTQPLGHTAENPDHLAYAIETAGPENVMFASDIPHGDFDPPEELFDRVHDRFDAEAVDAMMGGTALELYDL